MDIVLKKPSLHSGPSLGPFGFEQFQTAYVTNDMDRACAIFSERYGISAFAQLGGPLPEGGDIRIGVAWAGGTIYEIICAHGAGAAFYTRALPTDRFAIRHHHLGFLVPSQAAWDRLQTMIVDGGWNLVFSNNIAGFMRACYIEAPELDHYLEYMLPEPAGLAFFETAPVAGALGK